MSGLDDIKVDVDRVDDEQETYLLQVRPHVKSLLCYSVMFLAINVSSLLVSITDGKNSCQDYNNTALSLQTWLLTMSCVVISTILVFWMTIGPIVTKRISWKPFVGLLVIVGIFCITWTIVGIVILARDFSTCVSEGQDIGIMALTNLCWNLSVIVFEIIYDAQSF